MKQVFLSGDGQVEILDVPAPSRMSGAALVQNAYSLISAGTEGAALSKRGGVLGIYEKALKSSDKLGQVWDMAKQKGIGATFQQVQQRLADQTSLGYSSAGRVIETGSGDIPFRAGDLVACIGTGFANHAQYVTVPKNLMVRIPDGVGTDEAAFGALACIAMQGIRRLDLTPGETIGVVGLGLIGQLAVRLLSALGYRACGIDLSPERVEKVRRLPGVIAWTPDQADGAARAYELTGGTGLDGVIICAATGSSEPVNQAFDMCRKNGRVAIVGSVGMQLLREKMYVKELELRMSCSYGPGRYDAGYEIDGHDYPINHARWTERRNLELFLQLLADKRLSVSDLITARYKIDQAKDAYAQVKAANPSTYGILFDYELPADASTRPPASENIRIRRAIGVKNNRVRLGLIGVGAYAKGMHIPNLRALPADYEIAGIASRSGGTAAVIGQKTDAATVTSDYRVLLDNKEIDAVLISTRHASHAKFILDALDAGKHVFVEKPMTTTVEDAVRVVAKADETGLILRVGFNRRFAPHMGVLRQMLGDTGQRMFSMRVNIGAVGNHWSTAAEEGGRFLGEAVHFLDLANWMFGATPDRIASVIAGPPETTNPNLMVEMSYPSGAAAQLLYTSIGSTQMGKEYYEAYGGGHSGWSRDFDEVRLFGTRTPLRNLPKSDKGQKECLREFAMAIRGERHPVTGADARAGLSATALALRAQDIVRHQEAVSDA